MAKTWRCFFCDEVFKSRKEAHAHFGEQNCESDPPACVDPLRHDEKRRMAQPALPASCWHETGFKFEGGPYEGTYEDWVARAFRAEHELEKLKSSL